MKKLYYSISEVSSITNLKQYVLRYWETEFSQLSPKKNTAGNRKYTKSDIKTINLIQNLLYKKKFTINGARQYLSENKKPQLLKQNSYSKEFLTELKVELEHISKLINKIK